MKRIYDFKCPAGHMTEALVEDWTQNHFCGVCGEVASRIISPVRIKLDGCSGDFPSATRKWERDLAEATKIAEKRLADHGEE